MVQPGKPQRLAYIDWMRGFACLLMFEVHCYDSWLGGSARDSHFMQWSQLSGTIPAPLFLFLAGVSFALVSDKMRAKGATPNQIARTTILRGAEILGLGLLFRVQEYLLGIPWAPWTDLLRVDILNTIGISIMLMGVVGRLTRSRAGNIAVALVATAGIAFATPFLYTTWRPRWLPWYLESYINGVHIYDSPRPWLFPIFPWAGFAFAGLALGYLLFSEWGKKNLLQIAGSCGFGGVGLFYLSNWLDARALQLYPDYDFALLPRRGWAAGMVVDYLATLPEVDMKHIALFGYSRDGKMAAFGAALDDRISAVIPASTGVGGAL